MNLDDISKPDYFGKKVQNGYLGTLRPGPIGHVQLPIQTLSERSLVGLL